MTKATYITLNKDLTTKKKIIIETRTEKEFCTKNTEMTRKGYRLVRIDNITK